MSAEAKPQYLFTAETSSAGVDDSHRMLMDDLKITSGSVSTCFYTAVSYI